MLTDNGRTLFYTACKECKKKVNPSDLGYFCEKCRKEYQECDYAYNFTLRIGDYTSSIYAQVLGESVGNAFWGMTAKDLKELMEQ